MFSQLKTCLVLSSLCILLAGCATKPAPFNESSGKSTVILNYRQRGATIDGRTQMVWQRHPFKEKAGIVRLRPGGLKVLQIPPGRYVLRQVWLNNNWRGAGDFHLVTRQPYYAEFTVHAGDVRYLGDFTIRGDASFYENPVMQQNNGGDPLANALAMMLVTGVTAAFTDPFTPADIRIILRHDLPAVLETLQQRYSNFAASSLRRIKHEPPLLGYWAIDNIVEKEEPDDLAGALKR